MIRSKLVGVLALLAVVAAWPARAQDPEPALEGTVTSSAGEPLAGARVGVERVREPGRGSIETLWEGETDPAGRFAVAGLQPGAVRVRAHHTSAGRSVAAWVEVQGAYAAARVDLALPATRELVVRVAGPLAEGGAVVSGAAHRGDARSRVPHQYWGLDAERPGLHPTNLPPGDYQAVVYGVDPEGRAWWAHEAVALAAGDGAHVLTLRPRATPAPRTGRVTSADGEPAPAWLTIRPLEPSWLREHWTTVAYGVYDRFDGWPTDRSGAFALPGLPPGRYRVRALPVARGLGRAAVELDVTPDEDPEPLRIACRPAAPVEVRAERFGGAEGLVLYGPPGLRVEDFEPRGDGADRLAGAMDLGAEGKEGAGSERDDAAAAEPALRVHGLLPGERALLLSTPLARAVGAPAARAELAAGEATARLETGPPALVRVAVRRARGRIAGGAAWVEVLLDEAPPAGGWATRAPVRPRGPGSFAFDGGEEPPIPEWSGGLSDDPGPPELQLAGAWTDARSEALFALPPGRWRLRAAPVEALLGADDGRVPNGPWSAEAVVDVDFGEAAEVALELPDPEAAEAAGDAGAGR